MNKVIVAGLGLLSLLAAQPAAGADIPVKSFTPVETWNWSGLYVGANAGYAWGRSWTDVQYYNNATGVPIIHPDRSVITNTFNVNGAVAGGQIGANWQTGLWVFGVEADYQWSGQEGESRFLCARTAAGGPCLPGTVNPPAGILGAALVFDQKLGWFATARLRAGITIVPTVLAYITGGLAYGEIKTEGVLNGATPANVIVSTAYSGSKSKAGWTVGFGVESQLIGNWTGKIEYLFIDFGSTSGSAVNPAGTIRADYQGRFTESVARIGLNYKFPTAVVVARY